MPEVSFDFTKQTPEDNPAETKTVRSFEKAFQTALLLALQNRGLLDRRQFDLCLDQLNKNDV